MPLVDLETVRLFLHVLAASIWVGGQITLAALVPVLRAGGADVPKAAARAFARIAWPAFGVLILTGIWNVVAEDHLDQATRGVKYALVLVSGVSAFLHGRASSRSQMASWGAAIGLSAVATLFVGIVLAG